MPDLHRIAGAARAFATAAQHVDKATDPAALMCAIVDRDMTFHDLLIALDMPCGCEVDTCTRDETLTFLSNETTITTRDDVL